MNRDLTTGNPGRALMGFCLPLFGSIIFQQLYNIADSFVAGKFISDKALAAVGNSYEITLIFIAFAFGCNIGCSVIAAQLFGARRYSELKTAVYSSLIATAVLCAVLMAVGMIFCSDILDLMNTDPSVKADSELYLDIYILGLPFVFFYNVATGIFSALGDSKTPFIFLAISSTANIFMDIWFVVGFGMKVDGVAWATFICQGISCILAMIVVFKRFAAIPHIGKVKIFSWRLLGKVSKVAVPSILQQSFISVGNIAIQSIINSFGTDAMAGYSAAIKLNNMVISAFTTLGNGISNFTAQNLGAGLVDRVKQGFKAGVKLVWALCVPIVLIYLTLTGSLIDIFLKEDYDNIRQIGCMFLWIVAPFYFVVSLKLTADGILRGAGLMKQFMVATFTDLVLRVVLAAVFANTSLGTTGIWCAWPIGWVVATIMSLLFYRSAIKNSNKLISSVEQRQPDSN